MRNVRMLLSSLLMLTLLLACAYAQETPLTYSRGDKIQDFTFTTYDGQEYAFNDLLADKDAIMINIWASWCGPCKHEFPFMQESYEEYKNRIEVIALSGASTDTPDKLADFAAEYGLTFKVGMDPVGFLDALGMSSFPTTLMVDRFGTICYVEAGAQTSTDSFKRLFEVFVGDDYTESILLDAIPSGKPDVAPSEATALANALGSNAKNPTNAYVWPMVVAEKDGRTVVASTNVGKDSTRAEITAYVEAKAGDAIVVTFKTSTEALYDLLTISVNGKTVKSFGGEHDWMSYAIPVNADGIHSVKVSYIKDRISDAGADTVWIDSIGIAENTAAALAANPVYPVAEKNDVFVTDQEAREITIEDPIGLLKASFGNARYYIVNRDKATVQATLSETSDPEQALFYCSYGKSQVHAIQAMTSEGYEVVTGVDSLSTTRYLCSSVVLYLDINGSNRVTAVLFRDEENLNKFIQLNALGNWTYIDSAETITYSTDDDNQQSNYILRCVDQDGKPVVGVMLQVCDEGTCQVLITDTSGVCQFTAAPYPWEVHILSTPAGYTADSTEVVLAPVEGGELVFTLTAN